MIGGGVLRECLEDSRIQSVLSVGRRTCGLSHPKLRELIRSDLFDLDSVSDDLTGFQACFFCLGVSSAGMTEAAYRRVTYDLTMVVAKVVADANTDLALCYVSGQGTDSSGSGRSMWARVKGETENKLLSLPLKAYMFRPGVVQALKGVRPSTKWFRALYTALSPLLPVLRRLFPGSVTTTVNIGQAMIHVAIEGNGRHILETRDINSLAGAG